MEGPFTNAGLKHLVKLKNLTTLSLGSDYVTAEGVAFVAELRQLDNLDLDTPLLTDDIIPALLRCSAFEEMSFTRSALSDAGLRRLRDELPNCSVRDLQRDRYEFGSPPDLEGTNDKNRKRFEHTAPFLTLLAEAGDCDLVDGTFHKIGDRYGHWVDATQYSPEERVIMLVWHSSGIIDNGGFEYLFAGEFPGDPDYHITAEAFRRPGCCVLMKRSRRRLRFFRTGRFHKIAPSAMSNIRPRTGRPRSARSKTLARPIRRNSGKEIGRIHSEERSPIG